MLFLFSSLVYKAYKVAKASLMGKRTWNPGRVWRAIPSYCVIHCSALNSYAFWTLAFQPAAASGLIHWKPVFVSILTQAWISSDLELLMVSLYYYHDVRFLPKFYFYSPQCLQTDALTTPPSQPLFLVAALCHPFFLKFFPNGLSPHALKGPIFIWRGGQTFYGRLTHMQT